MFRTSPKYMWRIIRPLAAEWSLQNAWLCSSNKQRIWQGYFVLQKNYAQFLGFKNISGFFFEILGNGCLRGVSNTKFLSWPN